MAELETHQCPECHIAIDGSLAAESHLVFEHSWGRETAKERLAVLARLRAEERRRRER